MLALSPLICRLTFSRQPVPTKLVVGTVAHAPIVELQDLLGHTSWVWISLENKPNKA